MQSKVYIIFLLLSLTSVSAQDTFSNISSDVLFGRAIPSEAIAVGDYDNDGYDDIYVSLLNAENLLYRNNGNGSFSEVSESLGLNSPAKSKTALWCDINNDGWSDLYIANQLELDQLFLNQNGSSFLEISIAAGIDNIAIPQNVIAADYNNDGYIDLYVANIASENILYHNRGDNTFKIATLDAGVSDPGTSMGAIFFDYDSDDDIDLYLVHDNFEPNILYSNNGDGTYTDVSEISKTNTASYGMGADVADINNDGYMDIYITNLFQNILLLNNGDGTYSDISSNAGVDDFGMGWGMTYLDCNMDGLMDIYVANDSKFSPESNILYSNNGDLTYTQIDSGRSISNTMASFGVATTDYNLDGAIDLLVANREQGESIQLFENNTDNQNKWIGLKLIGSQSNRDAIGSKILIYNNSKLIGNQQLLAGHGWTSQSSNNKIFGLGNLIDDEIAIHVIWASGIVEEHSITSLDAYYTIIEGEGIVRGLEQPVTTSTTDINLPVNPVEVYPTIVSINNPDITIQLDKAEPIKVEFINTNGHVISLTNQLDQTGATSYKLKTSIFQRQAGMASGYIRILQNHSLSTHSIIFIN